MDKGQKLIDEQYVNSLDELQFEDKTPVENFLDIHYTKLLAIGAFKEIDFLYPNDGNCVSLKGKHSKTALAHKVMIDNLSHHDKIKVFAKGFHENIFDVDIVIEAFKKYVEKVVNNLDDVDQDTALVTLISNDPRKNKFDENLKSSEFIKIALELSKQFSLKVIEIFDYSETAEAKLPKINLTEKSTDKGDYEISIEPDSEVHQKIDDVDSFGLFGNAYRYRIEENHKAFINFGDKITFKALDNYFGLIKKQLNPRKITAEK
ncbi:MAG: hypothetical protein ACRBHB_09655 [Arenicella sp.]